MNTNSDWGNSASEASKLPETATENEAEENDIEGNDEIKDEKKRRRQELRMFCTDVVSKLQATNNSIDDIIANAKKLYNFIRT